MFPRWRGPNLSLHPSNTEALCSVYCREALLCPLRLNTAAHAVEMQGGSAIGPLVTFLFLPRF